MRGNYSLRLNLCDDKDRGVSKVLLEECSFVMSAVGTFKLDVTLVLITFELSNSVFS
jgi:hypothetical protein